jgi:transposase
MTSRKRNDSDTAMEQLTAAAQVIAVTEVEEAKDAEETESEDEMKERKYKEGEDDDEGEQENADPNGSRPRKKRGKYRDRLSDRQRYDVIEKHVNEGMGPTKIVKWLQTRGVVTCNATIDSILRVHREEDRIAHKEPLHRHLYTVEEEKTLLSIQQQHSNWTYSQLRAAWKKETGSEKKLSDATMLRILRRYHVTTKNLEPVPVSRNTPETIEQRAKYAAEAMTWDRGSLIFIDETGFHAHLQRRRGRSIRGKRAFFPHPNSAGKRINVCAAVSPEYGMVMQEALLTS